MRCVSQCYWTYIGQVGDVKMVPNDWSGGLGAVRLNTGEERVSTKKRSLGLLFFFLSVPLLTGQAAARITLSHVWIYCWLSRLISLPLPVRDSRTGWDGSDG